MFRCFDCSTVRCFDCSTFRCFDVSIVRLFDVSIVRLFPISAIAPGRSIRRTGFTNFDVTPATTTTTTMWRALVRPAVTAGVNHAARARGACARTARATARATRTFASGGEGNNITSALVEQMRGKIAEGLEADAVDVRDESGNARHVSIKVVSKAFEGKSSVNRQRMVYKCIWMELQDQVHAVNEMVTLTPEEASK
jgi:stress-induced morphogen